MFLRRGSWYSLGKVGALCCAFSFLPPLRPSQAQAYTNVHLISTWTQMHLHVTIVQLIPFTVIHGNYQGSMRKHRHNEQASHHAGGNNELVVCEKVGWLQERGLKMMWCLDVGRRVMSCSFLCTHMESSCVSSRRWWLGVAVTFTFLVLQAALGPGTISSGSGKWVCNCRRQRRCNRRRKTFSHSGTRPPCNNWRVASAKQDFPFLLLDFSSKHSARQPASTSLYHDTVCWICGYKAIHLTTSARKEASGQYEQQFPADQQMVSAGRPSKYYDISPGPPRFKERKQITTKEKNGMARAACCNAPKDTLICSVFPFGVSVFRIVFLRLHSADGARQGREAIKFIQSDSQTVSLSPCFYRRS